MVMSIWQEKGLENNWRRIFPALYPWKSSNPVYQILLQRRNIEATDNFASGQIYLEEVDYSHEKKARRKSKKSCDRPGSMGLNYLLAISP